MNQEISKPGVEKETKAVASESSSTEIPSQYQGLPSEVVEELWVQPEYIDTETNQRQKAQKVEALAALRKQELQRELGKKQSFEALYATLPENDKVSFVKSQSAVADQVTEHSRGRAEIAGLSIEEYLALEKIQSAYQKFKQEHPTEQLHFEFGSELDKQVYENLQYRLAFQDLNSKRKQADTAALAEIRTKLELPQPSAKTETATKVEAATPSKAETLSGENSEALGELKRLLDKRAGRSNKGKKIWDDLFDQYRRENNKEKIAGVLMNEVYNEKRVATYPINPNYEQAWQYATQNDSLEHRVQNGWVYRGKFPKGQSKTETRGSLNVTLDTKAVQQLDDLIQNGTIEANYKFGEPNTGADASERHDAVTIYFLTSPSPEALAKISAISGEHFRGNELLGKEVSKGFYMSEVGSVSDQEARNFIGTVAAVDAKLGKAVKDYLTSNKSGKERVAMSEAQFYAVKDTLKNFGVDVAYNPQQGFQVKKTSK